MNWTIKYFYEKIQNQILKIPKNVMAVVLSRLKEVKENDS